MVWIYDDPPYTKREKAAYKELRKRLKDKKFVENFEGEIKKILLSYINDPKVNIETMGYESSKRYYDLYDIERYDLEALNYFIKSSDYKGNLFEILNNALNCVKLENTHPISRKWFFF